AAEAQAIALEAVAVANDTQAIADAAALTATVAQTNADAAAAAAIILATGGGADSTAAAQATSDAVAAVLAADAEAAAALNAAATAQTIAADLSAAFAIKTPDQTTPVDSLDFLYSRGEWTSDAGGVTTTGLDDVDFWIGGLAEKRMPFGGYLGSTHNFVFETQMESLQNGDRLYYVARTGTIHLFSELESNSFTALVMRNTNLGENGGGSLPINIFVTQNHILEVNPSQQFQQLNAAGDGTTADPMDGTELIPLVIRDAAFLTTNIDVPDTTRVLQYTGGDHVTVGGTVGSDTIIGGIGDDSLYGRAGADRIEGGDGADLIEGGSGDDIITDLSGPDVIEGGAGNDAISSGNEEDVIFGDSGNDFIVNSSEFGEIFGGLGDDFIFDGFHNGHIRGGAGDDWMENLGGGEDLFQGDNGAAPEAGEPAIIGNDVGVSYDGNNDWDMENGDDIVIDGPGIDRVEGQLGFDWVSFVNDESGVDVDLDLTIFNKPILPPSNDTVNNRYDRVEGISGSSLADILSGTANAGGDDRGNELVNIDLIAGLAVLVPLSEQRQLQPDVITGELQFGWAGGEIILGGGGSDLLIGEGGNDIIDGDASLRVAISTPNPAVRSGSLGQALRTAKVAASSAGSQADLDQDAVEGFGAALAAAQAATEAAVNAAAEARLAADLLEASKVGISEMTVTGALGNLIAAATGDNGQPFTEALFSFLDLCASTLAEVAGFDVDATAAKTAQEAAVAASEAMAAQAALTLASVQATRDLSAAAVVGFQMAESDAQAALDLVEGENILVPSMRDIMGAVFAGDINPGELSIFRGIIYDSDNTSVDSAVYSGVMADYTIESAFTTTEGTSVTRVTDSRLLSDGSDLVSNVERLVFSDITHVLIPNTNSVAMGVPTISGMLEAGSTLVASMADVTDEDNINPGNLAGAINGTVDFTWAVELEPGSGVFEPLLADDNGNGDFAEVHGQNLTLTNAEAGLRIRVEAIFLDDAKVWEIVRSVP
ncbi:MAG: peroxidase family protein, partial [bacterium]